MPKNKMRTTCYKQSIEIEKRKMMERIMIDPYLLRKFLDRLPKRIQKSS